MEAEKLEKKLAAREAMLQDTLRQLSVSKFLLQDLQQDQSAARVGRGGLALGVLHARGQVMSCRVTCHSGVPEQIHCNLVAACGPQRASWSLQICSSVGSCSGGSCAQPALMMRLSWTLARSPALQVNRLEAEAAAYKSEIGGKARQVRIKLP